MLNKQKILQLLHAKLDIQYVQISDDSDLHAKHPEAQKSGGGHYSILIVSNDFSGKTLLVRHRMIHQALKEELKNQIHALAIKALSVEDFTSHNKELSHE